MKYGVCILGIVPVRKSTSDAAEIVTQLLFGERVEILERKDNWLKIQCEWDKYEGWIDHKQIEIISEMDYDTFNDIAISNQISQKLEYKDGDRYIVLGSSLCNFKFDTFKILGQRYVSRGFLATKSPSHKQIIEIANQYLNAPYLWGGRTPFGIDCSGLTQMIYKYFNIRLPRDASQQVEIGSEISFLENSEPGDLAFFEKENGKITHVGILISPTEIIHAHGKVRTDKIDQEGIYNDDLKKYTHKLRVIKRILE